MIDRTTLDLRLAAHCATTARVNGQAWQRQAVAARSRLRAVIAARLVSLAVRLDPTTFLGHPEAAVPPTPTRA